MDSAIPAKKYKSTVLAALDLRSSVEDLENLNLPLTRTKRKRTPGSPDPRQRKRTVAGIRSNIPGFENVLGERSADVCLTYDLISLAYLATPILQPPPSTAGLPKDHRQEFGINYNEDAPISRLDLAAPDQQQQYDFPLSCSSYSIV